MIRPSPSLPSPHMFSPKGLELDWFCCLWCRRSLRHKLGPSLHGLRGLPRAKKVGFSHHYMEAGRAHKRRVLAPSLWNRPTSRQPVSAMVGEEEIMVCKPFVCHTYAILTFRLVRYVYFSATWPDHHFCAHSSGPCFQPVILMSF